MTIRAGLLFCLLLAFAIAQAEPTTSAQSAPDAEGFTEDEQKELDEVVEAIGRSCAKRVVEAQNLTSPNATAAIVQKAFSPKFCACLKQTFRGLATPSKMRGLSESEGEELGKRAGAICLRDSLKEEWEGICQLAIQEVVRLREAPDLAPKDQATVCQCGKDAIDQPIPDEIADWAQLFNSSISMLENCASTNGIVIGGKPYRVAPGQKPAKPEEPIDEVAEAKRLLKDLAGRWSRNCQDASSNIPWTVYVIPEEGPMIMESYRGGDPAPTLLYRDRVLSAQQLPDGQVRVLSKIVFLLPWKTEGRSSLNAPARRSGTCRRK